MLGVIVASLSLAGPVREGVFLADDHPTNVFHLWFARTQAGPFAGDPWNPWLNAGKPAYYLYPPGWLILAWALDAITFRAIDLLVFYRLFVLLLFLLPGLSAFAFLRALRTHPLVAAVWGLVANIAVVSHGHGDYGGFLMRGMLNARLAWTLAPLVLLGLTRTFDPRRGLRPAAATGLALGALLLCHPWHAVVPVLVAILWACASLRGRDRLSLTTALGRLILVGAVALGLAMFWLLPTLEQRAFMRRGTLWHINVLPMLRHWIRQHWALLTAGALAGVSLRGLKGTVRRTRDMVFAVPVLALFIAAVLGVVQRAGYAPMFEARRFKDDLILGLILLGGLGMQAVVGPGRFRPLRIIAAGLLAVACGWSTLTLRPGEARWSTCYREDPPVRWLDGEVTDALRLDDLWPLLRGRPGRVLFTAATIHAERGRGEAHLMTLTPVFTGREIVNGTSTHHTPVSVFLQTGTSAGRTERLAEKHDNQHLFGIYYSSREPADRRRFLDACRALDVTDIVVHEEENRVLRFLGRIDAIRPRTTVGPFHVFEVPRTPAILTDGRLAVPYRGEAWWHGAPLAVPPDQRGRAVLSVPYQRQWALRTGDGTTLPITESVEGLIQFDAPHATSPATVTLDRRRTWTVPVGRALTILALAAALLVLLLARRLPKSSGVPPASSRP